MSTNRGEVIALALVRLGLTQAKFAKRIGVSDPTVSRWISGETLPESSRLAAVCRALHISADDLLGLPSRQELIDEERDEALARLGSLRAAIRAALDESEVPQPAPEPQTDEILVHALRAEIAREVREQENED